MLTEGQENLRKIRNEDTGEVEVVLEKRMNESRTHKREGYFVVEVRMNGREEERRLDGGTGVDERGGRVEEKKEWMREEEERMGERGVDEGGSG